MNNDAEIPNSPDDLGALGTQVASELPPELLAEAAPETAPRAWALPATLAALGVLVVAPFYLGPPAHVAIGPWPGFLAQAAEEIPGLLPPYWRGTAQSVAAWGGLSLPFAANLVALATLVLLAMLVAVLAARMSIQFCSKKTEDRRRDLGIGIATGLVAACSFLASESAHDALLSGGPAAFSAVAALLGYLLFLQAQTRPGLSLALLGAAGLLGIACVDQPYFLVLAALFFIRLLVFAPRGPRQFERCVSVVVVFACVLLWPALRLVQGGMPPFAILEHLLQLPYPDASFSMSAELGAWSLPATFPFGPAFLLILALLFLSQVRAARAEMGFILLTIVLLWPLMRVLANPPHDPLVPIDFDAPVLLTLALLISLVMAAATSNLLSDVRAPLFLRIFCVVGVLLVFQGALGLPLRDIGYEFRPVDSFLPPQIEAVLAPTPKNATVVVGDLNLAGMLWGLQREKKLRPDLHIVPGAWLDSASGRRAANAILDEGHRVDSNFPSPAALERWHQEMPLLLLDLQANSEVEFAANLHPFALWDLVSQANPGQSIYFLAESTPWLEARAQVVGEFLIYPPDSTAKSSDTADLWRCKHPITALGVTQRKIESSIVEAQLEPRIGGVEALPYTQVLEAAQDANGVISDELRIMTNNLWRADLLHVLRAVYETLAAAPKPDAEVHYQRAAVYAQLGLWKECGAAVAEWMKTFPEGNGTAFSRLSGDGRFALYLRHAAPTQPMPQPDSLPRGDATKP